VAQAFTLPETVLPACYRWVFFMGEIQAFTKDHIPGVADLYMKVMRGKRRPAAISLRNYFGEIFLENPWVAEDIPSLVYLHNGVVAGFMGVIPRTMEFKGRAIRVAATTQFMVDHDPSPGPAAISLLSRLFKGPQDLTFGDGASEDAQRIYTGVGGHAARLYSFNWLRPLRPLRTLSEYADRATGVLKLVGRVAAAAAVPVEFLLTKVPHEALRMPESPYRSTPVDSDGLLRAIQEIGWRDSLKPVYEPESFRWLIAQTASARKFGELRTVVIHEPDGTLAGWYVCWIKKAGPANLLQIGARRANQHEGVLLALFRDAWQLGATSVKGQSMPAWLVNLTNQYCLFRIPNTSVVFHSRDTQIVDAIYRGNGALTRLDGECWLRFSSEAWS
jgi:hypothetical protein